MRHCSRHACSGAMGKGGYGKGWSNANRKGSWQPRYPQWQQGKGQWNTASQHWRQPQHFQPQTGTPSDSALASLCGGMLSSAWDGMCSGVASAAWQAVQGTAGALLKARTTPAEPKQDGGKNPVDTSAHSIMACLAGKPAEPLETTGSAEVASHGNATSSNSSLTEKMVLTVLEMQKQQMQQHTLLQEELLKLKTAQAPSPASADMSVDESHEDTVDKEGSVPSGHAKSKRTPAAKTAAEKRRASTKAKAQAKGQAKVKAPVRKKRGATE